MIGMYRTAPMEHSSGQPGLGADAWLCLVRGAGQRNIEDALHKRKRAALYRAQLSAIEWCGAGEYLLRQDGSSFNVR